VAANYHAAPLAHNHAVLTAQFIAAATAATAKVSRMILQSPSLCTQACVIVTVSCYRSLRYCYCQQWYKHAPPLLLSVALEAINAMHASTYQCAHQEGRSSPCCRQLHNCQLYLVQLHTQPPSSPTDSSLLALVGCLQRPSGTACAAVCSKTFVGRCVVEINSSSNRHIYTSAITKTISCSISASSHR
jgi:non-ribosomal peptide synthetase component F